MAPTTPTPDAPDVEPFIAAIGRLQQMHDMRRFTAPGDHYIMGRQDWPESDRFQLQFHQSPAIIRAMFVGNGAGKTTVAGMEADWWLQHTHPYQHIQHVPDWPIQIVWVCMKFQQMEELKKQLEQQCFTPGWTWNDQKHRYLWPNGSTLTVFSNDGDWGGIQGIPADLVILDEECDEKLWREVTMRRRGRKKTRFVIAATATKGKRWAYTEVFEPWREFHELLGFTDRQAMHEQKHPTHWVWPYGGIDDNPLSESDPDNRAWYEQVLVYASAAERTVRLGGGFMDFNASPVFHQDNVQMLEEWRKKKKRVGQVGLLVEVEPGEPRKFPNLLHEFKFVPGEKYEGGTITIFEEPEPGDVYVIGADFGAGLENQDLDAAVVISRNKRRQVGQALGRWGDVHFAWVLWCLGWYFNEALLVGERQFGLPTMRRLHDEWGYAYQYTGPVDESKVTPRKSDLLGHHRYHGDLVIPRLQWAIAPQEMKAGKPTGKIMPPVVEFVDVELIDQLKRYEWKPRKTTMELVDTHMKDLACGAPSGYHDDLVMAAAYSVMGFIELPRFVKPPREIKPGSLADVLGHKKILAPSKKDPNPFKYGRKSTENPGVFKLPTR